MAAGGESGCQNSHIGSPMFALTTLGAMETWGPGLRHQRILMNGDNEVAVGVHNKGATKEAALDAMARAMAHTMLRHGFEARSKHVPSEEMLADPLSRGDEAAFLRRYAESGLAARFGPAKRVSPPTDFMLSWLRKLAAVKGTAAAEAEANALAPPLRRRGRRGRRRRTSNE